MGLADELEMERKGSQRQRLVMVGSVCGSVVVPPTEIRMQGLREQARVPCMCSLRYLRDIQVGMSQGI